MEENRLCDSNLNYLQNSDDGGARLTSDHRLSRPATNPQNISLVTETYTPEINGVAITLANLVKGLVARRHRVSVVHPRPRKRHFFDDSRSVSHCEDLLVRGLPLPGYKGLQFGLPARRFLRRSWRLRPPAVVYVPTRK